MRINFTYFSELQITTINMKYPPAIKSKLQIFLYILYIFDFMAIRANLFKRGSIIWKLMNNLFLVLLQKTFEWQMKVKMADVEMADGGNNWKLIQKKNVCIRWDHEMLIMVFWCYFLQIIQPNWLPQTKVIINIRHACSFMRRWS